MLSPWLIPPVEIVPVLLALAAWRYWPRIPVQEIPPAPIVEPTPLRIVPCESAPVLCERTVRSMGLRGRR
jgi:hypothetical protein